jgi:hypothetical protein
VREKALALARAQEQQAARRQQVWQELELGRRRLSGLGRGLALDAELAPVREMLLPRALVPARARERAFALRRSLQP